MIRQWIIFIHVFMCIKFVWFDSKDCDLSKSRSLPRYIPAIYLATVAISIQLSYSLKLYLNNEKHCSSVSASKFNRGPSGVSCGDRRLNCDHINKNSSSLIIPSSYISSKPSVLMMRIKHQKNERLFLNKQLQTL